MVVKKLFAHGKRIFTLVRGGGAAKKNYNRPLRYYLEHRDRGTSLARWLDYSILLLVIWLFTFLLLEQVAGSPLRALAISVAIPAVGIYIIIHRNRRQAELKHNIRVIQAVGKKCLAELETMPARQFAGLVRELLANRGIILEAPISKSGETDFLGRYNDTPVTVRCLPNRAGAKVTAREVAEFVGTLASLENKRGLIVAAGEFDPSTNAIKARVAHTFHLEFIDLTGLADLARQARHPVFPDPAVGETLLQESRAKRQLFSTGRLRQLLFSTRAKAKTYLLTSVVLMSFYLLQNELVLAPLYFYLALLNLILALACLKYAPVGEKKESDLICHNPERPT